MNKGSTPIKLGSLIFAKIVVYAVGIAALAVCLILLPELVREESVGKATNPYITYSFLGGAYVLSIPFFAALYQTLKLLKYFERNKAFTRESIQALRNIKICAIVFGIMIIISVLGGMIVARSIDPREDITGFVTLGCIFTSVSVIIAVFVAVLQKLLADAIAMKSENDLIV